MQDKTLFTLENGRPTHTVGALWLPYVYPDGVANPANNLYLDLEQAVDLARDRMLYAHFKVKTTFAGAGANTLRFCAFIDSVTNFANVPLNSALRVAAGPDIATSGLVAGNHIQIAIPIPSNVAIPAGQAVGKRYLAIGHEALVPATDWTAGGVDAWFSPNPEAIVDQDQAAT